MQKEDLRLDISAPGYKYRIYESFIHNNSSDPLPIEGDNHERT